MHPHAAATFAATLAELLRPQAGEKALDLYAGAGLFTALLAEAIGHEGRVLGVEWSRQAVADAAANLADLPWADVQRGRVSAGLVRGLGPPVDLIVLDPPRAGAGRDVWPRSLRWTRVQWGTWPAIRRRWRATYGWRWTPGGGSPHCAPSTPSR